MRERSSWRQPAASLLSRRPMARPVTKPHRSNPLSRGPSHSRKPSAASGGNAQQRRNMDGGAPDLLRPDRSVGPHPGICRRHPAAGRPGLSRRRAGHEGQPSAGHHPRLYERRRASARRGAESGSGPRAETLSGWTVLLTEAFLVLLLLLENSEGTEKPLTLSPGAAGRLRNPS